MELERLREWLLVNKNQLNNIESPAAIAAGLFCYKYHKWYTAYQKNAKYRHLYAATET